MTETGIRLTLLSCMFVIAVAHDGCGHVEDQKVVVACYVSQKDVSENTLSFVVLLYQTFAVCSFMCQRDSFREK